MHQEALEGLPAFPQLEGTNQEVCQAKSVNGNAQHSEMVNHSNLTPVVQMRQWKDEVGCRLAENTASGQHNPRSVAPMQFGPEYLFDRGGCTMDPTLQL
jgi:hypothetical protein